MKQILHLYKEYYPVHGGVQYVIKGMIDNTSDRYDHIVLTTGSDLHGWQKYEGTNVYYCHPLFTLLSMPVSLKYIFMGISLGKKADIICLHYPFPLADLILSFLPSDKKIIYVWHSDIVSQKKTEKLVMPLIKSGLRRAVSVLVSSPVSAEKSEVLKDFSGKVVVCPFGVDTRALDGTDAQDKKNIETLKGKYGDFILGLGRLVPYKGFNYLIEALPHLPDKNLVIIGSGNMRDELYTLAVTLGVADRVFILHDIEKKFLKAFFHACSVFCFPSCMSSEAFGIAMLEAMACGCRIVNADVGSGVNWVAGKDLEAYTAENKNPASLAAGIKKVSEDEEYGKMISSGAYKRASVLFDNSTWRSRLLSIFDRTD